MRLCGLEVGRNVAVVNRVIVIIGAGLTLAACSSTSGWLGAFKPAPVLDTVRLESEPPGADAKTSNGQACKTPCALALPTDAPLTVTFSLNGYLPDTEKLDSVDMTGAPPQLQPNPLTAELEPAPPPPKPAKPVHRHVVKKKPAPRPAAAAKPAPAPAPAAAAPAQQPAASPWPAPPPPPAEQH